MNRLAKAIEAGRSLVGKVEKKSSPKKKSVNDGNRLSKAISRGREIKASEGLENKLSKGRHDALYYYALHGEAALRGSKKVSDKADRTRLNNVAKKYMFMFLRHCLEAVRDSSNAGSMKYQMGRISDFYCSLACDACGEWDNSSALVHEYMDGKGFESSLDDDFNEDYQDDGEPEFEGAVDIEHGIKDVDVEASY